MPDLLRPEPPSPWRARAATVLAAVGGRPVAAGAAGVVAVVLLAFVIRGTAPPELQLPVAAPPPPTPGAAPGATTAGGPPAVVVHVAGAVARPGVHRLPAGSRVGDAIAAAGGPLPGADPDRLNLAAPLDDGQRVWLPRPGELPDGDDATVEVGGDDAGADRPAARVDLNTADREELEALPGVGPATAEAILDHRRRHGRFRSVDELLDVRGIGDAKLATLRPLVRV